MEPDDDTSMLDLDRISCHSDDGMLIEDVEMPGDELLLELKELDEEGSVRTNNYQMLKLQPPQVLQQEMTDPSKHKIKKERLKQDSEERATRKSCENNNEKQQANRDRKERDVEDSSSKHKRSKKHGRNRTECYVVGCIDKKRLNRYLDPHVSTDPMIIGREIAYRLRETKMKLIGHVVRVLGVNTALAIFEEAKTLINKGGLKTDDGDRKRSPGGTFLYIMKNRAYASDQQLKEIFKQENARKSKIKKRKKREEKVESKYANKISPKESSK